MSHRPNRPAGRSSGTPAGRSPGTPAGRSPGTPAGTSAGRSSGTPASPAAGRTPASSHYNTRQREAIVAYLTALGDAHVTVEQIAQHFAQSGTPIGRTTIYRQLNRLESEGLLRRFATDKATADCYQYIATPQRCSTHFHLLCSSCGQLLHVDCAMLNALQEHVAAEHDFTLDVAATVFRGTCRECLKAHESPQGGNDSQGGND
ncbi:MAG: transcriptional repressor [Coriobacteriales bacterium]|nr:transcriptional repressor [Coriobacteriales bacterium]